MNYSVNKNLKPKVSLRMEIPDDIVSLNFPLVLEVKNNIKVIVDYIQEINIPVLFRIAQANSSSPSSGVSPSDFPSEKHFRQVNRAAQLAIQYTLQSSGKCVGFSHMFPSEICRSCRPISSRGFTVLDPKIHNIGLGKWGLRIGIPFKKHIGMPGHIARSSATNVLGILHARRLNLVFTACIPESYKDSEGRWHDDLLSVSDFLPAPDIYQMQDHEVLQKSANNPFQLVYAKTPFKGKNISQDIFLPAVGSCRMYSAKDVDLLTIYPILMEAATRGEGFGLDEFPSQTIFRTHFLKERTVIVLQKVSPGCDNTFVAVAVIGPSRICRTPDPQSCSIYMWVKPEWRNQGIGTGFAKLTFKYIKESGYNAVLTDVLVTDPVPYQFMMRLGFSNIGCVPKSAYVAGKGYTDAIMFYQKLDKEHSSSKI